MKWHPGEMSVSRHQTSVQIDLDAALHAGKLPMVLALIAGLIWLIVAQPLFVSILAWVLYIVAGLSDADRVVKNGRSPGAIDAAANGAVAGALTGIAYSIGVLISQTLVRFGIFVYGFDFALQQIVAGAVAGGLAAVLWGARHSATEQPRH